MSTELGLPEQVSNRRYAPEENVRRGNNVPKTTAHVFSKAREVIVDSRKSFSDMGFLDSP